MASTLLPRGNTFAVACKIQKNVYANYPALNNLTRVSSCGFGTSPRRLDEKKYQVLVIGGGTGGSAVASKMAATLGRGKVAMLEPSEVHYYQPMFTLVGAGRKKLEAAHTTRHTANVLPKKADWIKDGVAAFDPENNRITTTKGDVIQYDLMCVAMGLQLRFDKVKGLVDALEHDPMVCSNYNPVYAQKHWAAQQAFTGGNAIYTFPTGPVKCAGAPQKACYLTEDYFRLNGKRDKANVYYNTALPVIFGIPRYAEVLLEVVNRRGINVNYKHNLIEVNHSKKEAIFELLESGGKTATFQYDLLHVSPPMSTPEPLFSSKLVDAAGLVNVDRASLQHVNYPNVFAIGDCSNTPAAKTAAACSSQALAVKKNMVNVMAGRPTEEIYDGYASCPLTTTHNKCVLAEFGFDGKIMETFPFGQNKERRSMFYLKAEVMPHLYWMGLLKGWWNGPKFARKLFHLGMK